MAPRDSPREPTDETVILPGEVGLVAFWRSKESWEVSVERGVEGGRGGNDGVRSPYLGSTIISPCPQPEASTCTTRTLDLDQEVEGTYQKQQLR